MSWNCYLVLLLCYFREFVEVSLPTLIHLHYLMSPPISSALRQVSEHNPPFFEEWIRLSFSHLTPTKYYRVTLLQVTHSLCLMTSPLSLDQAIVQEEVSLAKLCTQYVSFLPSFGYRLHSLGLHPIMELCYSAPEVLKFSGRLFA